MAKKSKKNVIARSQRLYLSDFGPQYAAALDRWLHDPKVYGHLKNVERRLSLADQRTWIDRTARDPTIKVFSVHYIPDDRLIGYGGFKNVNAEDHSAEVWRILGERSYQGRGLGTELYWLFCSYGFEHLGYANILAEHPADHPAGWVSAMKCGAKWMGTRREAKFLRGRWADVHYTDLLPEELTNPFAK